MEPDAGHGLMLCGNRSLIDEVAGKIQDFSLDIEDDFGVMMEALERNPDEVSFAIIDTESVKGTDATAVGTVERILRSEGIPCIFVGREAADMRWDFPSTTERVAIGLSISLPSNFRTLFDEMVLHSIQYRYLYKHSVNGLCTHRILFDGEGQPHDCEYLQVNRAYETVTGLLSEHVVGKTIRDFFSDADASAVISLYWDIFRTGRAGVRKLFFAPFDQWFNIIVVPVSRTVFTLIIQNITAAREIDRTLEESNNNFKAIINSGIAMIWTSGTDKKCDYFNEPWLNFTGRQLNTELGDGWTEGVHPDDLDRCMKSYASAFDRRERFEIEYRLRNHTGEYRWILDCGSPRYDTAGKFLGYVGHCIDVHSRKLTERALDEKMDELERFHRLAVDREYRILELKKEVNSMLLESGQDQKYSVQEF